MFLQALTRPVARPVATSPAGAEKPSAALCYDIETIPDFEIERPDGETFPKPYRHRVVCISVAVARIDRDPDTGLERYAVEEIRSGGDPSWPGAGSSSRSGPCSPPAR